MIDIKNLPFFPDLSLDEQEALLKISEQRVYPKGSIVIYEGDKSEFCYFILKGSVKVSLIQVTGRETIISVLKVGEFFGEMSAFDQLPRSATIITEEDCEFLAISQEGFTDVVKTNPEIAIKIIRKLSLRLRDADEMINTLSHRQVKARIARTLLKIAKAEGIPLKNKRIQISRPGFQDLAAMTGTSRETVSRIINSFSKEGILELTKQEIIISAEADILNILEQID